MLAHLLGLACLLLIVAAYERRITTTSTNTRVGK